MTFAGMRGSFINSPCTFVQGEWMFRAILCEDRAVQRRAITQQGETQPRSCRTDAGTSVLRSTCGVRSTTGAFGLGAGHASKGCRARNVVVPSVFIVVAVMASSRTRKWEGWLLGCRPELWLPTREPGDERQYDDANDRKPKMKPPASRGGELNANQDTRSGPSREGGLRRRGLGRKTAVHGAEFTPAKSGTQGAAFSTVQ
jgi:hypothetical protein